MLCMASVHGAADLTVITAQFPSQDIFVTFTKANDGRLITDTRIAPACPDPPVHEESSFY